MNKKEKMALAKAQKDWKNPKIKGTNDYMDKPIVLIFGSVKGSIKN